MICTSVSSTTAVTTPAIKAAIAKAAIQISQATTAAIAILLPPLAASACHQNRPGKENKYPYNDKEFDLRNPKPVQRITQDVLNAKILHTNLQSGFWDGRSLSNECGESMAGTFRHRRFRERLVALAVDGRGSVSAIPITIAVGPAAIDAIALEDERKHNGQSNTQQDLPGMIFNGCDQIVEKLHGLTTPHN